MRMVFTRIAAILVVTILAAGLSATAARASEAPDGTLAGALAVPVSASFASPATAPGAASASAQQSGASAQADTLRSPEYYQNKWPGRFWMSAFDIVVVNEVIWMYNRFIREGGENPEFRKGWNSFTENLQNGFEWDDNNFSTNHFLHPYHGSLYFTGARSKGYSFWESVPFAFAGSWWWEYFGEVNHASINDWVNTSVGGIAFGEVLFRLSNMVFDNTATGSSRTWREVGGFLVAPVHGFNRLISGEAFEVHANPPGRFPSSLGSSFDIGVRTIGQERFWTENSTKVFMRFRARYGDVYEDTGGKPFDAFNFLFHVNLDNPGHPIGRIEAQGLLYGNNVSQTETTQHVLAAEQHFDYYDNEAYTFGNQSVGAALYSKFVTDTGFETRTAVHANGVILGAAKSDYFNVSGRDYDYGPGLGFKFSATFGRDGHTYFGIAHEEFFIHSINGNKADHYVNFTGLYADVPLRGFFGLKFEYLLYLSESRYANFPDTSERSPEIRAYFSFDSN